ncbi:sensor histidine kinase [Pseudotenacibaculum sp. MALMAid0570]|uniref:tetratricopeptide repeat-containing sensor histidine kinase n=1 Tax=Pseudotenacibaculum sp. MALMAid0570 TaxID=3143938 RepID=UPI0032E039F9
MTLQQVKDSILYNLYSKTDSVYKAKNHTLALELAFKILDDADPKDDLELISKTNFLIGKIWYASKSYDNAISYFKYSLDGLRVLLSKRDFETELEPFDFNSDYSVLNSNLRIGNSFQKLFEKSIKFDTVVANREILKDSAIFYYQKVIKNDFFDKKRSLIKARAYNNISGIYIRLKDYDLAEEYTLKSLEIKENHADVYSRAAGYNALFNIHFARKEYNLGIKVLKEGLKVLEKTKGFRTDELSAAMNLNIAYSLYMLKDYRAYDYQEKAWSLYDKIKTDENEKLIANIYAERNYKRGLDEGILQQEIKKRTAQRNTWILGISSFFIIVLLVFLLNQYKLRQKNLSLELSKQELVQQQKIEKIKSESQIRILNATIDGKEKERKQIAETLHDSVSALLSSANLHLQACKKQFNGTTPIEVDKSQSIINEASQKIRDLSHTLVSSILLKFGLSYAIKDIAEKFSNSELKIDYETKYIKRYDQRFEIKLYNIIQEFVNNILKHSKASYAKVTLVEKKSKLYLTIEDNGQGFDKTKIPEKDGLGINQIDARIQMMQGKFHIESGKGKGTTISIELPVFEKEVVTIS